MVETLRDAIDIVLHDKSQRVARGDPPRNPKFERTSYMASKALKHAKQALSRLPTVDIWDEDDPRIFALLDSACNAMCADTCWKDMVTRKLAPYGLALEERENKDLSLIHI